MEGMGQAWTALAMALGQLQEDPVPSRTPGMGTAMDEPPPCAPFHPGICSSQNLLTRPSEPGIPQAQGHPLDSTFPFFYGMGLQEWFGLGLPTLL